MCGARVSDPACAEGVNVPLSIIPFACAGRNPGCRPKILSNCSKNMMGKRQRLFVSRERHIFNLRLRGVQVRVGSYPDSSSWAAASLAAFRASTPTAGELLLARIVARRRSANGRQVLNGPAIAVTVAIAVVSDRTMGARSMKTDNESEPDSENNEESGKPIFAGSLPPGCPPDDANRGAATFYAAHRDQPPSESDFTTAWQRDVFRGVSECQRKSNSVMADERDARHLLQLFPRRYRFVSRGSVTTEHGVWKHLRTTNYDSHHSLWVFEGVRMRDVFTVII